MPSAEHSRIVEASPSRVWVFVRDMDNWAPLVVGYQRHEKRDERSSHWLLKGELGGLTRIAEFDVRIDDWDEAGRVSFTLQGVNEPVTGSGSFEIAAVQTERGGSEDERSRIDLKLTLTASGRAGLVFNALLAPMMKPVAEDLAEKIAAAIGRNGHVSARIESSHSVKQEETMVARVQSPSAWSPIVLSLLRIVAALLFLEHGLMKLWHFPAAQPGAPDPLPAILLAAAIIEVVCGSLVALGLLTRIAAFIAAGEMAVAYFTAHAPMGFWPALNHGEAAILYCFVFFYLAFSGGGEWSLDAVLTPRWKKP